MNKRDHHKPVFVHGAKFTFRTFHGDDGWTREPRMFCPDRLVTLTLAAVAGLRHYEPATIEVRL